MNLLSIDIFNCVEYLNSFFLEILKLLLKENSRINKSVFKFFYLKKYIYGYLYIFKNMQVSLNGFNICLTGR